MLIGIGRGANLASASMMRWPWSGFRLRGGISGRPVGGGGFRLRRVERAERLRHLFGSPLDELGREVPALAVRFRTNRTPGRRRRSDCTVRPRFSVARYRPNDDCFGAGFDGLGGVTAANDTGIWADDGSGTLQLVARVGGLAPGTSAYFSSLSNPAYNHNAAVAFFATLQLVAGQAGYTTDTGVWSSSGGSLALVARRGGQAPGCPAGATFGAFDALALPDQGGLLLLATLNLNPAAGVTAANQTGIWAGNSAADLHLIVRQGAVYNGKTLTAISFLPRRPYVSGQTRSFAQNTGNLTFLGTFTGGATAIFQVSGGNVQAVLQRGASAPGLPGAEFSAFGNPALNANGGLAFAATVTPSAAEGIWADDNTGTLQLIARTGTGFLTLSDPVYNNNEAVAFRGALSTGAGIWSNSGGSLALVARQGAQAPGYLPGATFAAFSSLALPDQAGVIFLATLTLNPAAGVTAASSTGIWAVETGGNLQLIVRTGDILNGKTIAALSFLPILPYTGGQTRAFAQPTGNLAYQATFTDGTTAIFDGPLSIAYLLNKGLPGKPEIGYRDAVSNPIRDNHRSLPFSTASPRPREDGAWDGIQGTWNPLHGSFLGQGLSIEWHDFYVDDDMDWGRSFHPGSLEICLNFSGHGLLQNGDADAPSARISSPSTPSRAGAARAIRRADSIHRFLTVELSPGFLSDHFSGELGKLKPPVQRFIQRGSQGAPLTSK